MVAHEVAMITHEHDDGVFRLTSALQMIQNASDLGINMGDGAIVQRNRLAGFALGAGKKRGRVLDGFALITQLMQQLQMLRQGMRPEVEGVGQADLFRLVHVPVLAVGRVRVMRVRKRALNKEGLLFLGIFVQHSAGAFTNPGRGAVLFWHTGTPGLANAA